MSRVLVPIALLVLLLPLHVVSLRNSNDAWTSLPASVAASGVISPTVLKLSSLEYDGLAADAMFLRALVFQGGTIERENWPFSVTKSEWQALHNYIDAASSLDPYFLDPYYFAQANLTWDGGLIHETNQLLDRGIQYRRWDWMLPFFAGFNSYYFLKDNSLGSSYLMESAKRPGASPVVATLAARLALDSNQTSGAILFLQEMYKQSSDAGSRRLILQRLSALLDMQALERAVEVFVEKFKHLPDSLQALVTAGIISQLPVEPYGGRYVFDPQTGQVSSSTDLGKYPGK